MVTKLKGCKTLHRCYKPNHVFKLDNYNIDSEKGVYIIPVDEVEDFQSEVKKISEVFYKKDAVEFVESTSRNAIQSHAPQGSERWLEERFSLISSSNNPFNKDGDLTIKDSYFHKLSVDKFVKKLGVNHPIYKEHLRTLSLNTGQLFTRGHEMEEEAIKAFESRTGEAVLSMGFRYNEELGIGSSIDGILLGKNVGLEIKSPLLYNYFNPNLYQDYYSQMQIHILMFNLEHVLFIVFYPNMKLRIKKILPDYTFLAKIKANLVKIQELETQDFTCFLNP